MVPFHVAPELCISPHKYNCKGTLSASITTETSCWVEAVMPPAVGVSQDVQRTPNVCCEDIFNDENAQRPPQFHERPSKYKKKEEGREREKSAKFGMVRSRSRVGVPRAEVSRAQMPGAEVSGARGSGARRCKAGGPRHQD